MSEVDRIREYFEHTRWRPSAGRDYIVRERTSLLRTVVADHGVPLSEISICDVGCGYGDELLAWRAAGVAEERLAGTELLHVRARHAMDRLPSARIEIVNGFALPFAARGFDIVTASLVLSTVRHAVHRRALLAEMERVTKPGGRVVVYDFSLAKPWNRQVVRVTTPQLRDLWRQPDHAYPAAPFLPLLDAVLHLPSKIGRPIISALPRTHRLWIWQVPGSGDASE